MKKILNLILLLTLLTPSLSLAKEVNEEFEQQGPKIEGRIENKEIKIEKKEEKLASSSEQKRESLNRQIERQKEQIGKLKERLTNREFKIINLLENISKRIGERITMIEGKGITLTDAKISLAEAEAKISTAKIEADNLKSLLSTVTATSTATTTPNLNQEAIKAAQDKIRLLSKEAYGLLQETIRNINSVLPRNGQERHSTSTESEATTTSN